MIKKTDDDRRDLSLKDIYLKEAKPKQRMNHTERQRGGFFQMAPLYVHTRRENFLSCWFLVWNFFASIHFRNRVDSRNKIVLGVNCFTIEIETAHHLFFFVIFPVPHTGLGLQTR